MTKIQDKIEILQNISARLGGELQGIEAIRNTGAQEIGDNGEISQATCMSMAALLTSSEDDARQLYTGLLSLHQSLARFIPEGGNEGQKPWPP